MVSVSTLGNIFSWLVFADTCGPADLVGATFLLTFLECGHAFGILLAICPLFRALLFDTFLWINCHQCSFFFLFGCLIQTVVGSATLDNIFSCLVFLQTSGPAYLVGTTFLVAFLDCWHAFGILLAICPLLWALLLDAFLWVCYHQCSFSFFFGSLA